MNFSESSVREPAAGFLASLLVLIIQIIVEPNNPNQDMASLR